MKFTATIDLVSLRNDAKAKIDNDAESFRWNFITPGSGQAMSYQEKHNEALAFLADPEITEEDTPHLTAEVGITGQDRYQVAQVIVNTKAMWRPISASIDRLRLSAKEAVDEATNPAEIEAATQVNWASAIGG